MGHPQQPKMSPAVPALLRRALSPGTILGAVAAGVLLFLPSHSFGTALGTAVLSFCIIGALRIADPALTPLWRAVARIPWQARYAAGILLPVLYSRSQFTPSASGQEIPRARNALIVSAVIAYVLMRPRKGRDS
jgi:hypothetical protein